MFEFNSDLEFDKIFDDDLQRLQPNTTTKRAIENEICINETNKKPCLDTNHCTASPTTSLETFKTPERKIKYEFLNKTEIPVAVNSPNKKVVLRKFPGPAGLLPERQDFNIDIKALEVNDKPKQDNAMDMDICSQTSVRAFHEGPWDKMSEDFHSSNNSKLFLLDKYNIAWIKDKVRNNKLINQKAPFLAAIIQNIEYSKSKTAVVSLLLKDTTGQIHGTIVYDLYEENINQLKVGSVVVLKQFGVLTTDHGCNLYITITTNNLVTIYSNETDDVENFSSKVKVTAIQQFSVNDFIKNINDLKIRHKSAEKLKSVLGFNENFNLKLPLQKPEVQHVNYRCSTPIQSRSSGHINVNFKNQNLLNTGSPKVSSPLRISNVNKINVSSNSISNKSKFNFKSVNYNNKATDALISENKNVLTNTPISIVAGENTENNAILQNIFDGVDTDLLFGDF